MVTPVASPRDSATLPRSAGWWRPAVVWAIVFGGLVLAAGVETARWLYDPGVYLLRPDGGAEWIRLDQPFSLNTYPSSATGLLFEHRFHGDRSVRGAWLTVRAFRRCVVMLDQATIFVSPEDFDLWQESRDLKLPDPLPPGEHLLQIAVYNQDSQPCLLAYSKELDLHTGPEWFVVQPDGKRSRAITVTQGTQPEAAAWYPSVADRAVHLGPWLLGIFALAFGWTLWNSRAGRADRWHIRPWHVHGGLLVGWVLLAANNIWQLDYRLGFDMGKHLEYIQYIVEHRSLPLANQGWEMFQPPFFYLVEAPLFALLSPQMGSEAIARALRVVPLLCGLAQIEIAYRAARAVFPAKEDLQTIATLVGGLLPVHIYLSQFVGNEPMAGALTAFAVLLCMLLLVEPARSRPAWFFVLLGVIWGLAVLSKVTPLLLAPLVVAAIIVHCRMIGRTLQQALVRAGFACGACLVTSGWYFLRNLAELGKLYVGNWDRAANQAWWQEPGYRTWSQLTSFGTSLSRPIYGGIWSLWDGLYSSMWLDGFVSGRILRPDLFPWNLDWLLCSAWLALVPMALICAGPATCWRKEFNGSRNALLFALAAVAIYLVAVADFYTRVPIYTTANARYMVGLLPCFAVLAAAGAAPLLRFRMLRALVFSAITCWAVVAYVTYFDFDWIRHLLGRSA